MDNWNTLVISLYCNRFEKSSTISKAAKCYRTFGNHDLITIAPISGDSANDTLSKMWENIYSLSTNIEHGESIYNLFAVTDNCGDFWSDFNESSYLFFSAIQVNFNYTQNFNSQIVGLRNEIAEFFSEKGLLENVDYSVYKSLDCGDLILFIKSDKYTEGAKMIHNMTIKSKHRHYSYSVCGFNVSKILNEEFDEVLPKAVVCSVMSDASNYARWFKYFETEYNKSIWFRNDNDLRYSSENKCEKTFSRPSNEYIHLGRLGSEDLCINIFNCRIKHLLSMTDKENGVFYYKNANVRNALCRFRINLDLDIDDISPTNERGLEERKSLIKEKADIWRNSKNFEPPVYKALVEILSSCEDLEKRGFAFDILDCILNVFPLFIEKIKKYQDSDIRVYWPYEFTADLIYFITGIRSIAEGSLHADKLFVTVPGFNAVVCDAPSKLLLYYTIYIQKLADILNDEKEKQYRFLLCPDLYQIIQIMHLFDYDDNYLLKVRIPIMRLFSPSTLLMELSHEVAHYVGREIRNRAYRSSQIIKIIAYTMADRLVRPLNMEGNQLDECYEISLFGPSNMVFSVDELLKRLWNAIPEYISEYLNQCVSAKIGKREHFSKDIKVILKNSIYKLYTSEAECNKLQNCICETLLEGNKHDSEKYKNSATDIRVLFPIIKRHIFQSIVDQEFETITELVFDLCSESFADIVMLILIKDIKLYLKHIYDTEKMLFGNVDWYYALRSDAVGERILSVLEAHGDNLEEIIAYTDDNGFRDFLNALKEFRCSVDDTEKMMAAQAIDFNASYLKKCLESLNKGRNKFEDISLMYRKTVGVDLYSCVSEFNEIAYKFREQFVKEHKGPS